MVVKVINFVDVKVNVVVINFDFVLVEILILYYVYGGVVVFEL